GIDRRLPAGVLDCEDKRHGAGCSKRYVGHGHSAHRCSSHDFRPPDGRSVRHDTPFRLNWDALQDSDSSELPTGKPMTILASSGPVVVPFGGTADRGKSARPGVVDTVWGGAGLG